MEANSTLCAKLLPPPHVCGMTLASMSMSIVDIYIAHDRKASNALCTLVKPEKKSFQVLAKNVKGTRDGSRR